MPETADFIAEVQKPDGSTMTMAIAVEGENVVAYATNGTNNETYFFGTQKDGQMELMSMYADEVKASFDGSNINGEMAMNDEGATVQKFTATRVEAPAGMYTAARDNSRATWIVRPNNTTVGVMDNSAPGDHKVTDAIEAKRPGVQGPGAAEAAGPAASAGPAAADGHHGGRHERFDDAGNPGHRQHVILTEKGSTARRPHHIQSYSFRPHPVPGVRAVPCVRAVPLNTSLGYR